jgi:hypothetical protein
LGQSQPGYPRQWGIRGWYIDKHSGKRYVISECIFIGASVLHQFLQGNCSSNVTFFSSGKTESTKMTLAQIARMSKSETPTKLAEQIVEVNVLSMR